MAQPKAILINTGKVLLAIVGGYALFFGGALVLGALYGFLSPTIPGLPRTAPIWAIDLVLLAALVSFLIVHKARKAKREQP
jgi:hypothetical protein